MWRERHEEEQSVTLARPRETEYFRLLRIPQGKGLETEESCESLHSDRLHIMQVCKFTQGGKASTLYSQVTYPPHSGRNREGFLQINGPQRLWTQTAHPLEGNAEKLCRK